MMIALLLTIPIALGESNGTDRNGVDGPNVVIILIDDLGWMDLAFQGNPVVSTPNLDALAQQGMRFTDAYAAAPVCSPTRAAILTGQAPARLRLTNHAPDRPAFTPQDATLLPAEMVDHLAPESVTIAEHYRSAGYETGFIGKWHLSGGGRGNPEFEPTAQGFQTNIGGCGFGGPGTFFDPYKIPNLIDRNPGEYLPDRLADEAIDFMREHKDEPFLLCLWNYTVHWPMEAPEVYLQKYAGHRGPGLNDYRYGAMIEAMDASIGRVLDELDKLSLNDETLVVFTSDNGGFAGVADNRPLRGAKGHLYEGGLRVPLIVRWPSKVRAGSECTTPVISMDFFPTLLEAAGIPHDDSIPCDGESLVAVLTESGELSRDALYFHYPNYAWHRSNRLGGAMRSGRYKLIERFDDGSLELFDLAVDLGEVSNLASDRPELAGRMQRRLSAWREATNAAMPRPR